MENISSKKPTISEAVTDIAVSADSLWDILVNTKTLSAATGNAVRADFTDNSGQGNGILVIGNAVFFARYSPYEAELNGSQIKIKLRAIPSGTTGCRVAMAAAVTSLATINLSSERLKNFLLKLKDIAEKRTGAGNPAQKPPDRHTKNNGNRAVGRNAEKPDDERIRFKAQPGEEPEIPENRNKIRGRFFVILMLLLILGSLGIAAYSRFREMTESTDTSSLISLKSAKDIEIGMTKSQISFKLGTNGITEDDNRVVYRSSAGEGERRPDKLISVVYSDTGKAKSVSFLDLSAATSVFMILDFAAEVLPEMSAEDVSAQLELPISLYRRYDNDDGEKIEEVHFGYLDPTANFNPAWRGEFEVIFNRTDENVVVKNWGSYDGADPTMISSIEGTPFANQYDNYTEYLNDRFQFSRSQLLLNRYSLGDTKFFFDGEPVHYSNDFGYQFYNVDSKDTVPDSDIPLYRISVGYDNKGAFRMASFSNMRLYNKPGMLKDSDYRILSRGMTYSEVRSLMRLLPTTIYIDEHYFSVCYGRFINSEVADEQFEIIIRFDLENNIAQKVLDNTAVSGVVDVEDSSFG